MAQEKLKTQMNHQGNDETGQIYRVAGYAFILNFFLAVMKGLLAFFSGSLAITASAIDSGTDAVASLVIYGGVKLSTKKTTAFPMGLYKLENVASILIAFFIFIAGYEIVLKIFSSKENIPSISLLYIVLLLAGTLLIFFFGQFAIAVGKRTRSPALIAEGRHRQVDVLSSIVVLVSVILSYFEIHWTVMGITIDQMGAALIVIFIGRAGWNLLSDGMRVLLDASIDFSTLESIRKILENQPMVAKIKSLTGRNAGRFRFIETIITLKTKNLEKAHQISEELETKIRKQVANVEKIIIHYEPQSRTHDILALPLKDKNGGISSHFGESPYFCIVRIRRKDNTIEEKTIVENPFQSVETAKGIRVAEWLVGKGVEHVGMKEDVSRKGPGYVLSSGGIRIQIITATQITRAIADMQSRCTMNLDKVSRS